MLIVSRSFLEVRKYIGNLLLVQVERALHQIIGLADELHVAVLNAVVHHLDEMTRAVLTHPVAARVGSHFGRDRLEYALDCRPKSFIPIRDPEKRERGARKDPTKPRELRLA